MALPAMFKGTGRGSIAPMTEAARLWSNRKEASEQLKRNHQGNWRDYWRWYTNWKQVMNDPLDWWRSNETDPEAFKVIETLLPKHILGMFMSQDWFGVRGRERNDAEYATIVKSLLTYMVDRMELFPKIYECLKYTLIMGHSWGKVTWKIETEDRVVDVGEPVFDPESGIQVGVRPGRDVRKVEVYNDPYFEWLSLDKVWPDPTGKGRWFIEQIETTMEELEEVNGELRIYKNLDILKAAGEMTDEMEPYNDDSARGFSPYDTQAPDGQKVLLQQCWGWVPKHLREPDGNAWRLTVIGNGMVEIRDVPIPTPDNRPPYFPLRSIPVPGQLFGESILKWVGPKCDQKTRLTNWRMDEVLLNIWGQYIIDTNSGITSNDMLLQPAGALFVEGNPNDKVSLLPRKPVLQEAYVEDSAIKMTIEDTAAATPVQQGVASSSRQTATEISTLRSQGDQRFILQTMYLDFTFKKELLTRGFKYYQKQIPPGRLIRIVGEEGFEVPVDITTVQESVDIIVESGLQAFGREARIESLSEFIQLSATEVFAPYLRVRPLLVQLSEDRGWRDPNRFVKTDEEVQQQQQAAMQQQVQLAQLEAQMEAQTKMAVEQAKGQADQQRAQLDMAKGAVELQMKQKEAEIDAVEQQMALEGRSFELEVKREMARIELETLALKASLEIDAARKKAAIANDSRRRSGGGRK